MRDVDLTIKRWLAHGWCTLKNNPRLMILGAMIFSLPYLICALLAHLPSGRYLILVFQLATWPPLTAGWWFLCLRLVRGHSAKLSDIFAGFRNFLKVWVTFTLVTLIAFVGLVLFVIPGIIWILKYELSLFIVMDAGLAPHKAVAFSGRITDGYKIKLFGLLLMGFLVMLLTWPFAFGLQNIGGNRGIFYMMVGIVPYLVGFWVVAPWLTAAWATAYDTLSKRYEQANM